jgi:hypothetical protein
LQLDILVVALFQRGLDDPLFCLGDIRDGVHIF